MLRDVGFCKEIELERGQEEKRLRAAALELERGQKIDRGPKIGRGHAESMNLILIGASGLGVSVVPGTRVRSMLNELREFHTSALASIT